MVSVLIIGLMLPCMVSIVDRMQWEADVSEAIDSAEQLRRHMGDAYRDGVGNWRTVDIDIPAGYSLSLGGDGTDGYAIRVIRNGDFVGEVYMEDPTFPVTGPEVSLSGNVRLMLKPVMDEGIQKMEVEVI